MASEESKKTYTSEQIEHMSQAIATHRSNLAKLKESTRNSKIIDAIHGGLSKGAELEVELKGAKRTDGGWDLAQGLEERWIGAVKEMQDAEEKVRGHRSNRGWLWFWFFVLALLGVVTLYIILHVRWPPTESNIFLWTQGRALVYAEVAFWAPLGLLTWSVYSIQHWIRRGEDMSVWSQWYLSKTGRITMCQ